MEISIKPKGMPEAVAAVQAIADRMQRPAPFLRAGGIIMLESVQKNFEAGGRPTPWVPLAAATIRRRRGWGNPQILRDKGLMAASIVPKEMTDTRISIGTNDPKAPALHYGATSGRSHTVVVPARPFLMIQDADKVTLVRMAGEFIVKGKTD